MKNIFKFIGIFLSISLIVFFNCQQPSSGGGGGSGGGGSSKDSTLLKAVQIVSNGYHTVVLFNNGTVKCWGLNNSGQLGYKDMENRGDNIGEMGSNLSIVDLGTGRTVTQIAAGEYHSVVLLDNGTVKCWGRNNYGQLGYEDTIDRGDNSGEMGNALPYVSL